MAENSPFLRISPVFFPPGKALLFSFGQVHRRGLRVVQRMPSGFRERLRLKPDTRGMHKGPLKTYGLQRFLVSLRVSLSKSNLPRPTRELASLWRLVRWSPIFLSFTSSCRKSFSRKSQRWGSVWVESHIQKGLVQILLHGTFYGILSLSHSSWATVRPTREFSHCAGFASLRDTGTLAFLLGQLTEEVAYTLQSHIFAVKMTRER